MSFLNTIVLLLGLVAAILVPLFVGHGLSAGGAWIGYGAGTLVVAVLLLWLGVTLMPREEPGGGH